jgi:hypothetical protein
VRDKSLGTSFGVALFKSLRATAAFGRVGVTCSVHAYKNDPDASRIGL